MRHSSPCIALSRCVDGYGGWCPDTARDTSTSSHSLPVGGGGVCCANSDVAALSGKSLRTDGELKTLHVFIIEFGQFFQGDTVLDVAYYVPSMMAIVLPKIR